MSPVWHNRIENRHGIAVTRSSHAVSIVPPQRTELAGVRLCMAFRRSVINRTVQVLAKVDASVPQRHTHTHLNKEHLYNVVAYTNHTIACHHKRLITLATTRTEVIIHVRVHRACVLSACAVREMRNNRDILSDYEL